MIVEIRAKKDIIRKGLVIVKSGTTAKVLKSLADEAVSAGDAELVEKNTNRRPVTSFTKEGPQPSQPQPGKGNHSLKNTVDGND